MIRAEGTTHGGRTPAHWRRVALIVARMTDKQVGLDTATRVTTVENLTDRDEAPMARSDLGRSALPRASAGGPPAGAREATSIGGLAPSPCACSTWTGARVHSATRGDVDCARPDWPSGRSGGLLRSPLRLRAILPH